MKREFVDLPLCRYRCHAAVAEFWANLFVNQVDVLGEGHQQRYAEAGGRGGYEDCMILEFFGPRQPIRRC